MLERSFQAQLLIPMAASLAFGLLVGTVFVLFLVPVFYSVYLWVGHLAADVLAELGIRDDEEEEHETVPSSLASS